MRGGRKGKGKEVAGSSRYSKFVPSVIHQSFRSPGTQTHGDMTPLADTIPSPTSHIPSSRAPSACSSSHVPNSPASSRAHYLSGRTTDDVQKIFIRPCTTKKFDKQMQCIQKIGELIEMRFKGAWKSWRKFPKDTRDLIFSEFEKYYEWDPTLARQIRSIFDSCAMSCIKNRMYQIRQTKKKPKWLGQQIFEDLNQIFLQDEFKKESERNKKNRASNRNGQDFPLHMAKQGHEPSINETFMHLRSKVNSEGDVKWVNKRAKRTHEEYTTKLSQVSSQNSNEEENLSTQEQIKIFSEVVGGPKNGVVYGLAGQDYNVMHRSSSSSHWSSLMEWESERTQLRNRINEMQSCINDLHSSFEARVKAAVEKRVSSMEARWMASMEARLMARIEKSFENKMRGLFVNPELPKSPSSHQ